MSFIIVPSDLLWYSTVDPTIAPGVAAPLKQLLVRTDNGSIYYKSGAAATAWTIIGSGGGGTGSNLITLTNNNAGSLIIGTPIYSSSANGMNKAIADGSGKSNVQGLVADTTVLTTALGSIAIGGAMVATTAQWDAICGTIGGLTFNVPYYLSPTVAGQLTSVAPVAAGQEVAQVIIALSTTIARIAITSPILL